MSQTNLSSMKQTLALLLALSATANADSDSIEVRVTKSASQYIVGEPVIAQVDLKVISIATITVMEQFVHDDRFESEIAIYVSNDGEDYRPIRAGIYSFPAVFNRQYLIIHEDDTISFRLRTLYQHAISRDNPNEGVLVFPKPGRYWLKFELPLFMRKWDNPQDAPWNNGKIAPTTERIEMHRLRILVGGNAKHRSQKLKSAPIEIEIKEPTGVDKKVWEQINSRDYWYFLQSRQVPREKKEIALKVARILKEVPSSSYHPGMRFALSQFLRHPIVDLTQEERELIQHALDTERGYLSIGPHAPLKLADDRLETIVVKLNYPRRTQLQKILEEVSKESGVTLQIAPSLERHLEFQITDAKITLGEFMQRVTSPGRTYWIPDGDGYVLTPVEPKEPAAASPPANDATDNDAGDLNDAER